MIRKKRLKAERIVDDFMRIPRRLVVSGVASADWGTYSNRLWAL